MYENQILISVQMFVYCTLFVRDSVLCNLLYILNSDSFNFHLILVTKNTLHSQSEPTPQQLDSSPLRDILHQTPDTFPQQRTQIQQRTLPFLMSITFCFVSSLLLLTPNLRATMLAYSSLMTVLFFPKCNFQFC